MSEITIALLFLSLFFLLLTGILLLLNRHIWRLIQVKKLPYEETSL